MKKKIVYIVCVMFILGAIFCGKRKETYAEMKMLNFSVETKSMTKLSLSWEAGNVTKYKLYRSVCKGKHDNPSEEYDEGETYRCIAVLSRKKTSYLDRKVKKRKIYHYMIKGYKGSKQKYCDKDTGYTGITCNLSSDDDSFSDNPVFADAQSVTLPLTYDYVGFIPDGYEIYRKKEGEKTFHFLTNVKSNKQEELGVTIYTDDHVEEGITYHYKARSYKTVEKKKYYSSYTKPVSVRTVNENGTYKAKFVMNETCAEDEAIILLTGQRGNEKMILNPRGYVNFEKKDDTLNYMDISIVEYSKDGKNWRTYDENQEEDLSLKEDEAIWLKIKRDENYGDVESHKKEKINCAEEFTKFHACLQATYKEEYRYFYMDLMEGKAWTQK